MAREDKEILLARKQLREAVEDDRLMVGEDKCDRHGHGHGHGHRLSPLCGTEGRRRALGEVGSDRDQWHQRPVDVGYELHDNALPPPPHPPIWGGVHLLK